MRPFENGKCELLDSLRTKWHGQAGPSWYVDIDFYDPLLIRAVLLGLKLQMMTIVRAQKTLFIP